MTYLHKTYVNFTSAKEILQLRVKAPLLKGPGAIGITIITTNIVDVF